MSKPKIFIVDDHAVFREGLKFLLKQNKIADVVGEAADGEQFLEMLKGYKPDLVFLDIEMPKMNGVEAAKIALEKYPDLKIIVLSLFGDSGYYYQMLEIGVKGFILKKSKISDIELAIKEVVNGSNFFSSDLLKEVVLINTRRPSSIELNEKESEVLRLICAGYSNEEIAEKIFLSISSVKNYKTSLFNKTGSKNIAELIINAVKNKLVEL